MTLNCIVVDDDPVIIEQIKEYITYTPKLHFVKGYTNPGIALNELLNIESKIDILFTDIEMPELTGFELTAKVKRKIRFIILISGHLKYALDGYLLKPHAFLSKPISLSKFKSTIETLRLELVKKKQFLFFKVKDSKEQVKLWIDEIIHIEANGNYVNINTITSTIITLAKLSEVETQLNSYKHFIRIHKSFIVSIFYIESYRNDFVRLTNKKSLPVSLTYRDSLLKYFD
ncbi:LytR/AlgR family response regulator transcription factor [Pedobacter sp. MW01-1-1]|uniref:LytR/AlgR family response regulator transcription factor n=1 Tax=Pedobacter sp. MW01-1-1 TaxID=3383027 RepID=UPI003FEF4B7A